MKRAKLSTAQDLITEAAVKASATSLINAGSVLMVTRSGILSHSLAVAVNLVSVALNQDIKAITPSPAAESLFLWFAFKCFERDILNECRKGGTTVHSIEFPSLLQFTIPLPPLAEQKRIVLKIEELFSELDAGEESLKPGTRYPATLVATAHHDDRVVPAHSFKFAARLQECQAKDGPPVLIRIATSAGHGAGTTLDKVIKRVADEWAFLEENLK